MQDAGVLAENRQRGDGDGYDGHGELVSEDEGRRARNPARQEGRDERHDDGDAQGQGHAGQGQVLREMEGARAEQGHGGVYHIKEDGQRQGKQKRGDQVARKDKGRIRVDHDGKDGGHDADGRGPDEQRAEREIRHEQLERDEGQQGQGEQPDEHESGKRAGKQAGVDEKGFGAYGQKAEVEQDHQAEAREGRERPGERGQKAPRHHGEEGDDDHGEIAWTHGGLRRRRRYEKRPEDAPRPAWFASKAQRFWQSGQMPYR